MSIVNKVLRDLDARHAGASERVGVPSAVTPLSVHLAKTRRIPWRIMAAVGIVIGLGAIWVLRPIAPVSDDEPDTAPKVAPGAAPAVTAPPPPQAISPPATTAIPAPITTPSVPALVPPAESKPSEPAGQKSALVAEPRAVKTLPDTPKGSKGKGSKDAGTKETSGKPSGHFIQIGAFAVRANAEALNEQLRRELGPLAEKVLLLPAGTLTLIQLGPWADIADARRAAETLRDKHGIASAPVLRPQRLPRDAVASLDPPGPPAEATPKVSAVAPASGPSTVPEPTRSPAPAPSAESTGATGVTAPAVTAPRAPILPAPVVPGTRTKTVPLPNDGHIDKQTRLPTAAERAESTYRRGLLIQRQGQLDDAASLLRAALEDNPEHAAARQTLAGMLIDAKNFDEAESVLRKGVDINSVRLPSVLALARLKVERNQTPAALELLQQNSVAGERSADFQGFTGALLNRAGKHKEASERYQAAAQLAPTEGRWWAALGIALEAQGRATEARDAYMKAKNLPGLPPELEQHIDQRLR